MTFHSTADVQSPNIGERTTVWQYSVILKNAVIGADCNINFNVFIENDVKIGDRVTVKSGVQIWDGITIGNDVFIGPNATFTNDFIPRSKIYPAAFLKTVIEDGASLGANCTILPGITIGRKAMIGAGSVVTKDVPAHTVWFGNPARMKGYITNENEIIGTDLVSPKTGKSFRIIDNQIDEIK